MIGFERPKLPTVPRPRVPARFKRPEPPVPVGDAISAYAAQLEEEMSQLEVGSRTLPEGTIEGVKFVACYEDGREVTLGFQLMDATLREGQTFRFENINLKVSS